MIFWYCRVGHRSPVMAVDGKPSWVVIYVAIQGALESYA
jgi:hypothetical protein